MGNFVFLICLLAVATVMVLGFCFHVIETKEQRLRKLRRINKKQLRDDELE